MPAGRIGAVAWVAAACGACLVLLVAYGSVVIDGGPLFDDWAFLDHVRRTAIGEETPLEAIFTRHNGHPSVPGRLAFFAAQGLAGLDLTWLRWASLVGNIGCAGLAGLMLARATGEKFDATHPAFVVGAPLAAALFLSNGHWETYSLAMGISAVVVNLFALGAVMATGAWLRTRSRVWLAAAALLGVGATLSMTQGMWVWLAMAVMIAVRGERKLLPGIAGLLAVFVVVGVASFVAVAGVGDGTLQLSRLAAAPFVLLGTPVFGMIRNESVHELDGIAGALAALALAWAVWSFVKLDAELRARAAPFLALLVYGAGTVLLIAWGRQMFPLPALAASRYAEMVTPALVGGIGLLCVSAPISGVSRQVLAGLAAIVALGWLITNQQEWALAQKRAANTQRMIALTLDRSIPKTEDWLAQNLQLDEVYAPAAARTIPWLEEQRLSVFGERISEGR